MSSDYLFESERLGFRLWNDNDSMPFSEMNADKKVMQYFPNVLNREDSDNFIARIMKHFEEYGYGLWAVEIKATHEFIGYIGFYTAKFEADFTPCVEIGWRLDHRFWNHGYATEGAIKCLEYGFSALGLTEVYSFTAEINKPSINVMKKIGLKEKGTFLHPNINEDNPLRPHVLYNVDKQTYDMEKNARIDELVMQIGRLLNENNILWGIGGSYLLKSYGIVTEVHDLDILVAEKDIHKAILVLDTVAERKIIPIKEEYKTGYFYVYSYKGLSIDVMSTFRIEHSEGVYEFVLDALSIVQQKNKDGTLLPFTSLEDWIIAYKLMKGRVAKVALIENYFNREGVSHTRLLERNLNQELPSEVRAFIQVLLKSYC